MRQYTIIYEHGPTSWGATVPDLPGCYAVGATREETERLIHSAIESHIEVLRELGEPVPEPRHDAGTVSVAV
jgi:predicted RNase H-like HicB family nuclease